MKKFPGPLVAKMMNDKLAEKFVRSYSAGEEAAEAAAVLGAGTRPVSGSLQTPRTKPRQSSSRPVAAAELIAARE